MKTPESVKHRCLTTTLKKYWRKDVLLDNNSLLYKDLDNLSPELGSKINLDDSELPILSYFKDNENWNIVTSHRIISKIDSRIKETKNNELIGLTENSLEDDMKGIKKEEIIIEYELKNEDTIKMKISIGRPCLSLINCIDDLIWMCDMEKIKYLK